LPEGLFHNPIDKVHSWFGLSAKNYHAEPIETQTTRLNKKKGDLFRPPFYDFKKNLTFFS